VRLAAAVVHRARATLSPAARGFSALGPTSERFWERSSLGILGWQKVNEASRSAGSHDTPFAQLASSLASVHLGKGNGVPRR
jgi:hypothetical protein